MKYYFLFFIGFLFWGASVLTGQSIVTDKAQLDFGLVMEQEEASLPLVVRNNTENPIKVIDIQFFDTYHSPAFYADELTFILEAADSQVVNITFGPTQNILHNTEMFIVTEDRGAFSVDLIGQGRFLNNYYSSTENLNGEALKDELTDIISSSTVSLGYNDARDEMYMEIDNKKVNGQGASVNTIEGVYTGQTRTDYANRSQLQNMGFNCEHTWPQSNGASQEPRRSDIHHLFPTNADVNSRRGSDPFGIVSNPTWQEGGSKSDNNTFEPRDEHKGVAARALLYFALRYQNESGVNFNWLNGQEDVLREWCTNFPPDAVEIARNEAIYTRQNNRNPLVDYPQLVERIEDFTTNANNTTKALAFSEELIDFGFPEEDVTYSFVIYNDGYVDIDLSNFNLTDNSVFSFVEMPTDITLPPGEDLTLEIALDWASDESQQTMLTFSQDITGNPTTSIPVFVNTNVGAATLVPPVANLKDAVDFYPNPAKNYLNIQIDEVFTAEKQLMIYDVQGSLIVQVSMGTNNYHLLPLTQLRNGVYFLQVKNEEQEVIKPFVVQK